MTVKLVILRGLGKIAEFYSMCPALMLVSAYNADVN